MSARLPLRVANADAATFECTFGRGCDGLCCKNGRPSLTPSEQKAVRANLAKFLPHLRPEARAVVERDGFVTARRKLGHPMLRVVGGWCAFFNGGCVFHKVGLEEGDFAKYKPFQCVVFPLEPAGGGEWYVRQWGHEGEQWDLFCLDPKRTPAKAVDALAPEIAFIERSGRTGYDEAGLA